MHQLAEDPDYGEGPLLIAIAGTARWPRQAARVDICFYTLDCGKPVRLHPHQLDQLPPPTDRVPAWAWPSSKQKKEEL